MAKKPDKKSHKKSESEPDLPDVGMDEYDEELIEEAEEAREVPGHDAPGQPSPEQGAGESAKNPPAGSPTTTVKIKGEGTVPVFVDGAMTRLERGKNIKVTNAQLEALKKADIDFKEV